MSELKKKLLVNYLRITKGLNKYSAMQKAAYVKGTSDHDEHNENSDYWDVLLGPIKENPEAWSGKVAMDFGCGQGRNINNLYKLADFKRIDGVDISEENISDCTVRFKDKEGVFYCNNGTDLSDVASNTYDLVMSTIVFQHIAVYDIRKSLLTDIYRSLKENGKLTIQMGFGPKLEDSNGNPLADYYQNTWDAKGTNSDFDVQVRDEKELTEDLEKIGFKIESIKVLPSFSDIRHESWIYVVASK
ncbi:class I SAM-dependent methyltransferase [Halobacteriovorax sp. DPLXC-1]|uniref:class I SAM-dependent methyltransferase n=1 Tax=Halobacteriovorax sp. DPLXC-1 TaxID=3110771 RepID=UPI002FF07892